MNQVAEKTGFKAGDILYSSWGYDQTNIDFYQVVRSTDKTVWIQEIEKNYIEQVGWAHYYVQPVKEAKVYEFHIRNNEGQVIGTEKKEAEIMKRKIGVSGDYNYVKISSFEFAYAWDRDKIMETHTC